jgi:hypothetical protein
MRRSQKDSPAPAAAPPEAPVESKAESAPNDPPAAIEALPEPQRVAPGLSFEVPIPDAPPAQPAKRPGLLRRVFGRIARPFSGKREADRHPSGNGKQ